MRFFGQLRTPAYINVVGHDTPLPAGKMALGQQIRVKENAYVFLLRFDFHLFLHFVTHSDCVDYTEGASLAVSEIP